MEIRRGAFNGDVKGEVGGQYKRGGAHFEGSGDGPQHQGAMEDRKGKQETKGHNLKSLSML